MPIVDYHVEHKLTHLLLYVVIDKEHFCFRFCDDIEYMTGRRPHQIWVVMWVAVCPLVIAGLLIGMVVTSAQGTLMYEIWDRVQVSNSVDYFDVVVVIFSFPVCTRY